MIKHLKRVGCAIALIPLFILSSNQEASASHAMGLDIGYECVPGTNQYTISLDFYRDCYGISAPTSALIYVTSASCGYSTSISLTQVGTCTEVSPLCPSALAQSQCVSIANPNPGVQLCSYEGTINLGSNYCSDWVISYGLCCRNAAITNLVSASAYDQYVEATLDNTSGNCANSSPDFFSLPTPYICANQPFNYNHGAFDSDGDSLVYSLCSALDASNTPIPYAAGYSAQSPVSSNPPITLDSVSGQLVMNPNLGQFSVVTMCITEYRLNPPAAPIIIGTTMRDLQVVVLTTCSNVQPVIDSIGNTWADGIKVDSFNMQICLGDSVGFDFTATDANADNITLTHNIATAIPGATFSQTPTGPVVTGTFGWRPTNTSDVGYNSFVVQVNDDGCPVLGANYFIFTVQVIGRTTAGPDQTYCDGIPVQLTAFGGSSFTWAVLSGDPINVPTNFSCNPCAFPQATPSVTTTYEVTSDLTGSCINKDTVVVTVPPVIFTLTSSNDTTICYGSSATISAYPNPAGTYVYEWTPNSEINDTTLQSPTVTPTVSTRTYYVTVTDIYGCSKFDSVVVDIDGGLPTISANRDTICFMDTTQLDILMSPATPAASYTWTPAGSMSNAAISNPICTLSTDGWAKVVVNDNGCTTSDSVYLVVNTKNSLTVDTIGACSGLDSLQLTNIITGNPLPGTLACGANGTTCTNPSNVVTVGTGTGSTGTGTPYEGFWHDGRVQYLYTAAQLNASGITTSGTITAIAFNIAYKNSTIPYSNFTVKMGCTSITSLTTWETGLSTVMGPVSYTTALGWNTHTLTNSFDWDGSSNIIVEVCFDNTSYTNDDGVYFTTVAYGATQYEYADNSAGCSFATWNGPTTTLPNIRFTICDAPPGGYSFNWTPSTGLSNPNDSTPKVYVPAGTTPTYTLTVTGAECTLTDSIVANCCAEGVPPYVVGSAAVDTSQYVSDSTFRILISEPILCSTIDPSGADFSLDCTGTTSPTACGSNSIISAAGYNCANDTSRWIDIEISNPVPGWYQNDWKVDVAVSAGITDTCSNQMTSAGQGGASGSAFILPLELVSFDGTLLEDNTVQLDWETAQELYMAYFDVERSVDGNHFKWIGKRNAKGSGSTYDLLDKEPIAGMNYYRLKQMEKNGNYSYSRTISINVAHGLVLDLVSVRPVPTLDNINVTFNYYQSGPVKIDVINLLGKRVMGKEVNAEAGSNDVSLNLSELDAGIYYISLYNSNDSNQKILRKIVKQ